jgi:hypothetical protein
MTETYQERWNAALMNNYGTPAAAATWTWSPGSR